MPVRTLILDDSPTMQRVLEATLEADAGIEVVGIAANVEEGRAMIKQLEPDVLTLDVELPGMDGISFLQKIMKLRPMPVVMISSHTSKGAAAAVEALSIGAFCCLGKPELGNAAALQEVRTMVKEAAGAKHIYAGRNDAPKQGARPTQSSQPINGKQDLYVIGSSTGGVEALTTLFQGFPKDCPPTVVTQHMPQSFTKSFAERLDRNCAPNVLVAQHDMLLQRGHIYIAPGGIGHTQVRRPGGLPQLALVDGDLVQGHKPSVDELFGSAAQHFGRNAIGVLLTGMGADGAQGLLRMKNAGATTISQSEETCLVYGMPAVAERMGASTHVVDLDKISSALFAEHMREVA